MQGSPGDIVPGRGFDWRRVTCNRCSHETGEIGYVLRTKAIKSMRLFNSDAVILTLYYELVV